jgi:hypothetical protein
MRARYFDSAIGRFISEDPLGFTANDPVFYYHSQKTATELLWRTISACAPGAYDPSTPEGLALLGHELVHVGQYARGGLTRSNYLRELLKHGSGVDNKYEKPAYDKGQEIYLDLISKDDKCCSQP